MTNVRSKIVVAVDFSEMTDQVLTAAKAMHSVGAEVHAVCVIDATPDVLGRARNAAPELNELKIALEARLALACGGVGATAHARAGKPAEEICQLAAELQADVIIIGRHGHSGPRRFIIGSVPARVLQLARCDVLVVQPKDYARK